MNKSTHIPTHTHPYPHTNTPPTPHPPPPHTHTLHTTTHMHVFNSYSELSPNTGNKLHGESKASYEDVQYWCVNERNVAFFVAITFVGYQPLIVFVRPSAFAGVF